MHVLLIRVISNSLACLILTTGHKQDSYGFHLARIQALARRCCQLSLRKPHPAITSAFAARRFL